MRKNATRLRSLAALLLALAMVLSLSACGGSSFDASGYVDASHDCCVIIRAEGRADTAEGCPAEDALVAALEQGVSAITLEEGK